MEVKQFLVEIANSKNPQAVMDSYFKKENSDPQPDPNVIIDELHNYLLNALTSNHPKWMSDADILEHDEMVRVEVGTKLPEMVTAVQDGIDRNYDMTKYIEFMKIVTNMIVE